MKKGNIATCKTPICTLSSWPWVAALLPEGVWHWGRLSWSERVRIPENKNLQVAVIHVNPELGRESN